MFDLIGDLALAAPGSGKGTDVTRYSTAFNLDGHRMHASQTAENGVVNADTIFTFQQSGEWAAASYSGGKVVQGYLVGRVDGSTFTFRYCQHDTDGNLDGGQSSCELERRADGGIRIIERFFWESRGEDGVNIIEDV